MWADSKYQQFSSVFWVLYSFRPLENSLLPQSFLCLTVWLPLATVSYWLNNNQPNLVQKNKTKKILHLLPFTQIKTPACHSVALIERIQGYNVMNILSKSYCVFRRPVITVDFSISAWKGERGNVTDSPSCLSTRFSKDERRKHAWVCLSVLIVSKWLLNYHWLPGYIRYLASSWSILHRQDNTVNSLNLNCKCRKEQQLQ